MAAAADEFGSDLDDDRSEASEISEHGSDAEQASLGSDDDAAAPVTGDHASGSGDDRSSSDGDAPDRRMSGDPESGPNAESAARDGEAADGSGETAAEPLGPFRTANKGAAIAKAFAKAARGAVDDTGAAILSGSKSVQKRQREEQALEATDKKARLLRQEMRRRGHATVLRRGEDPEADAADKALLRTARRGVVQLFNAVAKAQKQASEAQAPGARAKDKQLTKASFLAELRGKSAKQKQQAGLTAAAALGSAPSEQAAAGDAPAWKALQDDDFSSLQSGLRMKDWDKGEDTELPVVEETMADLGSDSDDS